MDAPSLLLITTAAVPGRNSVSRGRNGTTADSHIIFAFEGGEPEHPVWHLTRRRQPDVEVQGEKIQGAREHGRWCRTRPPLDTA